MSDLRNLLLDCRSALRRANRRFDEDPLRAKLDEALNELSKNVVEEELAEPETRTAQQVAYAWQIATRTVRLTHPDLYAKLAKRVTEMLDAGLLHDPVTEFIKLEAKLEATVAAQDAATKELADLRQALADAVPLSGRDAIGSTAECTQRRLALLAKAAVQGTSLPQQQVNDDPHEQTHTREELLAVVQGRRELSQWERSWCLAEAMVMTDKTAAQLKKLKDAELVSLVLDISSDPSAQPSASAST
jgi:hypothetical protein